MSDTSRSDDQYAVALQMAQRALQVKNDALQLLQDEVAALQLEAERLADALVHRGNEGVVRELQATRRHCVQLSAINLQLGAALAAEQARCAALESELDHTASAALELVEAMNGVGGTTDGEASYGSDVGDVWGSSDFGSSAEATPSGRAAPSSTSAPAPAFVPHAGGHARQPSVGTLVAALSNKLMAKVEDFQARMDRISPTPYSGEASSPEASPCASSEARKAQAAAAATHNAPGNVAIPTA